MLRAHCREFAFLASDFARVLSEIQGVSRCLAVVDGRLDVHQEHALTVLANAVPNQRRHRV